MHCAELRETCVTVVCKIHSLVAAKLTKMTLFDCAKHAGKRVFQCQTLQKKKLQENTFYGICDYFAIQFQIICQ